MPAVRPRFAARREGEAAAAGTVLAAGQATAPAPLVAGSVVSASSRWRFDARVRRLADVEATLPDADAVPVPAKTGRLLAGTPLSKLEEAGAMEGALRVRWCGLDAPCEEMV